MPSENQTLNAAIQDQLTNRTQSSGDDYLCRRCGNLVPDDFRYVFYAEDDPSQVWGPYCCSECIVYTKICTFCNKDFPVDDPEKIRYIDNGRWICHECEGSYSFCSGCGKDLDEDEEEVVEIPGGKKVCKLCFNDKYFTCESCGEIHMNNYSAGMSEDILQGDKARYSSVTHYCVSCFKEAIKTMVPEPITDCKYCGNPVGINSHTNGYCHSCISRERVRKCSLCGLYHPNGHLKRKGDRMVCPACESRLVNCSVCDTSIDRIRCHKINGVKPHYLCKDCVPYVKDKIECPNCLHLVSHSSMNDSRIPVKYKGKVCSDCHSNMNYCSSCDEYHQGEGSCRSNYDGIMNYSYRPALSYHHKGRKGPGVFFGFENEINYSGSSKSQRSIRNIYDAFKATELYLKSDASINEYGFEIVSAPMTLAYFNSIDFDAIFREQCIKDDTSCGLHVHVSRESFSSKVHMYKVVSFINNGSTEFIQKVAGREYCHYAQKIVGEKVSTHIKGGRGSKYNAVNLSPENTIEVRIFRGAKTEFQLRSRIEFVVALVEYTRNSSLKDATRHEPFVQYVQDNRLKYPSLFTLLTK